MSRSEADVAVAESRYAEAKLGPTSEERALADATVTAAEATRDVIDARAAKMLLRAPAEGIVGILLPEIGEAVVPGEPILDTDTGPRALVRLQPARTLGAICPSDRE
jgi:HlyD family secretion protein